MGIQAFARWKGQTKEEKYEEFLSEHWKSEIMCALQHLVDEAICTLDGDEYDVKIPARTLRERLPHALELIENQLRPKKNEPEVIEAKKMTYVNFVEMCERKEKETGEPVGIYLNDTDLRTRFSRKKNPRRGLFCFHP